MADYFADHRFGMLVVRAFVPVFLGAAVLSACDRGPAELAREIDAARGGCTEEMLKAGDEECVRMFERYADMAAGAMETYIGGMKAFDEAIQRRGGLQFDTAGLGHALGGSRPGAAEPLYGPAGVYPDLRGGNPGQGAYPSLTDPYAGGPSGPVAGGRWSDPAPGAEPLAEPYPGSIGAAGRADASAAAGRPSARRGVLLPPEERLRRPWIDDAEQDDRYVEGSSPLEPARAPNGPQSGWYPNAGTYPGGYPYPYGSPGAYPYPYENPGTYPYPYENPGAYPYPYGSAYPGPYGVSGAVPYPYIGSGGAYPYRDPAYPEYPYPDDRRGGW